VLLTRSPLSYSLAGVTAFDLHVLGTPPALILSQDQTLMLNAFSAFARIASVGERNSITRAPVDLALALFRTVFLSSDPDFVPCGFHQDRLSRLTTREADT
jgi:hypothetical protein